ncbi:unnamed protein product [Amoebophrya sp. A25]|nr:unnamed protein product [Amoebophrya sp. A25]|eukprot:GSA25T00007232001.1
MDLLKNLRLDRYYSSRKASAFAKPMSFKLTRCMQVVHFPGRKTMEIIGGRMKRREIVAAGRYFPEKENRAEETESRRLSVSISVQCAART